jgi:D-arabinose 1-dehydrogenase-like Zn-dependent alcohol dehydrogenase
MKAAAVHEFGEPLNIEQVPNPTPGPAKACTIGASAVRRLWFGSGS